MRQLEKLETLLHTDPKQAQETINDITESTSQLIDEVEAQRQQTDLTPQSDAQSNTAELHEALLALKTTAEQNEIDEALLHALAEHQASAYGSDIEAIITAINDFEFAQAVQLTEQLIKRVS